MSADLIQMASSSFSHQFQNQEEPNFDLNSKNANPAGLLSDQNQNPKKNENEVKNDKVPDGRKLDEILLPALVGHQALPIHLKVLYDSILPTCPSILVQQSISKSDWSMSDFHRGYILQNPTTSLPLASWKCANIPTTLQILVTAKQYFPNLSSVIDSLQKSLTQTVLVSLVNSNSNNTVNGVEMPMIASLAPNNTSLHLEKTKTGQPSIKVENTVFPTRDSLPIPPSPAKSEVSSTTETESLRSSTVTDQGMSSPGPDKMMKSFKNSKKRVQCDKCLHTFCDKGALKIHNSSVHLREMHMCTVPGCNKQFPSKRSRNRHSNNPNMHTETGRRRNCRTVVSTMNLSSTKSENQSEQTNPLQPPLPDPQVLGLLQRLFTAGHVQHQPQALDLRQNPNVVHQQPFLAQSGFFQTGNLLSQQIPVEPTPGLGVSELLKLVISRNMNFVKS